MNDVFEGSKELRGELVETNPVDTSDKASTHLYLEAVQYANRQVEVASSKRFNVIVFVKDDLFKWKTDSGLVQGNK